MGSVPVAAEEGAGVITPTPRERDVLELLNQGVPICTIAARLGIDDRTVSTHKARMIAKGVNVRRRVKKQASIQKMLADLSTKGIPT